MHRILRALRRFCRWIHVIETCHGHLATWFSMPHSYTYTPSNCWYQIPTSVISLAAVLNVLEESWVPETWVPLGLFFGSSLQDPVSLNTSNKKVPKQVLCRSWTYSLHQGLCSIQKWAELLGRWPSEQAKMGEYNCPQIIFLYTKLSRKVVTFIQGRAYRRICVHKQPK